MDLYTLKVNDDNNLITTVYQTIMQRSNLVDNVQFLIPKSFKTIEDMSNATVTMEYLLPTSKEYSFLTLTLNEEYNKDYLQYLLPLKAKLTAQAGEIRLFLTFTEIVQNPDGTFETHIEHTKEGSIRITAIPDFGNIDLDDFMRAFDQKLIAQDAILNKQDALLQEMYMASPKDIVLDSVAKTITLLSENGKLGQGVDVNELARLIGEHIVGKDPDGINDGITHLDDINIVDLDKIV